MTPGIELTEGEFTRFRELIYRVSGIHILPSKRLMVSNRLRRRLKATGISSFSAYFTYLTSPGPGAVEMPRFLDEITTNETYFYRDPHHFEWFDTCFLPEIARQGHARRPKTLRVWSAAASTGEELYSLAMTYLKHKDAFTGWRTTFLGTDLNEAVLQTARAGVYVERALRLVGPDQRERYFERDDDTARWRLKPEVRNLATWRRHNLLNPIGGEPFDLILLKNVLIYFNAESKQTVVRNLLGAMAEGGYLIVGPTEGVHHWLGSLQRQSAWLYRQSA